MSHSWQRPLKGIAHGRPSSPNRFTVSRARCRAPGPATIDRVREIDLGPRPPHPCDSRSSDFMNGDDTAVGTIAAQ